MIPPKFPKTGQMIGLIGVILFVAVLGGWTAAPVVSAQGSIINLGSARNYALLGYDISLDHADVWGGAVGIGYNNSTQVGLLDVEEHSFVHDAPVYQDPSATIKQKKDRTNFGQGVIITQELDQAFADALTAYNAALVLTPDQTIDDVKKETVITATHSGQYVVRITGDIKNQLTLTPHSTGTTKFIVLLDGTMDVHDKDIVGASSAAGAGNVLIVAKDKGPKLNAHNGSHLYGTLLAPYRDAELGDTDGALLVLGGGKNIELKSKGQIHFVGYNGSSAAPTPTPLITPMPTATPMPISGEQCYLGTYNPSIGAYVYWRSNGNGTTTIFSQFTKNLVDNTYGTSAIGWGNKGHKFSDLVDGDYVQLVLYDSAGALKMEFQLDYIDQSNTVPSGYKTLGVTGGDGKMLTGNASDVVKVRTALSENLNTYGYVLTTNSPVTDANYTPNAQYPNWIFDVWYEVTVRDSAFSNGFHHPLIRFVSASPSKTGNNIEWLTPGPCTPLMQPMRSSVLSSMPGR